MYNIYSDVPMIMVASPSPLDSTVELNYLCILAKQRMKKIVYVTGCLGFIGYHVTKKCLDKGWYVIGVEPVIFAAVNVMPAGAIIVEVLGTTVTVGGLLTVNVAG